MTKKEYDNLKEGDFIQGATEGDGSFTHNSGYLFQCAKPIRSNQKEMILIEDRYSRYNGIIGNQYVINITVIDKYALVSPNVTNLSKTMNEIYLKEIKHVQKRR